MQSNNYLLLGKYVDKCFRFVSFDMLVNNVSLVENRKTYKFYDSNKKKFLVFFFLLENGIFTVFS